MPPWKYVVNRFLTAFENLPRVKLSEYHTSYGVFSRWVLTELPVLARRNMHIARRGQLGECTAHGRIGYDALKEDCDARPCPTERGRRHAGETVP